MRRLILLSLCAVLAVVTRPAAGQQRTRNPHGKLSLECAACHRSDGWTPARISGAFDHGKLGFPLAAAHATASCRSCHKALDFKGTAKTCAACHTDAHRGELGVDCAHCHTARSFTDRAMMVRAHQLYPFPLEGAHLAANCTACHTPTAQGQLQFVALATTCVTCHEADYASAKNPDHAAGGFPRECRQCHTVTLWSRARFNHDASSFPLTGAHRTVACAQCHSNNKFTGTSARCASCHQTDFNGAKTPDHKQAQFSADCATCHTTTAWQPAPYDHNATQFPLTGAHKTAVCSDCHADGVYKGKATTCVSCHQVDYNGAKTPDHKQAQFATTCTTCHTTTAWQPAPYDHNATQFPLTGAHKTAVCSDCHADGIYKGKPTTCVSCHQPDFNRAQTPNHTQAQFPTTCATCHTTTAWQPAPYDHNATQFPLTGAHKTAVCSDCHADGIYKGKAITCVSCHQPDFNRAQTPNHTQAQFPTTCATCHTTTAWQPAPYDHNATQFPLTGAHKAAVCSDCHADGVYKGKPTTCVSCHQTDYNGARTPNHTTSQFPTTCATCHTTTAWTPATFDHAATQFPLTGAHRTATCNDCHANGVYNGKPTTCVSCHQPDYNGTKDPNHAQAQFPTDCTPCHTTTAWTPATFNHSATQFPLTGAHKTVACSDCHADGVYNGKPTTCQSCHLTDFNTTTTPNHRTLGWPQTCITCHSGGSNTTAWDAGVTLPSQYHTMFSVTHQGARGDCTQCHNTTNYAQSTCSNHHHPPTCTYLNQRGCGD